MFDKKNRSVNSNESKFKSIKKFNITNPVTYDLKKIGLIDKERISLFHNKTRDGNYNSLIDDYSGVIFLEENSINTKHYEDSLEAIFDEYFKKHGYFKDDLRRFMSIRGDVEKSKYVLDVGSEWGGFLKLAKESVKKIEGVELNQAAVDYVEKNIAVKVHKDIEFLEEMPDLVTMFHVLEHLPNQIDFLKTLYKKMKPGGKIVIEVPHANNFLLKEIFLPEFRDFILWNEHLVLHTEQSLDSIIQSAGFINSTILHIQRYGFLNHFGWFVDKKPNGHVRYASRYNEELDKAYCNSLEKNKTSDTLFCIASKP